MSDPLTALITVKETTLSVEPGMNHRSRAKVGSVSSTGTHYASREITTQFKCRNQVTAVRKVKRCATVEILLVIWSQCFPTDSRNCRILDFYNLTINTFRSFNTRFTSQSKLLVPIVFVMECSLNSTACFSKTCLFLFYTCDQLL